MSITDHAALVDRICHALATGRTLRDVCRDPGMPAPSTVLGWVKADRDGFATRYRNAREVGYSLMADEMLEIADDASQDRVVRNEGGEPVIDHEHISRCRLRVAVRRWLLARALPKIYGDRLDVEATHETGDSLRELMKAIDGRTRSLQPGD
ncbi:terminase small subunit protein [Bradyrhizobium sp. WD16]|uniref:terminase small subunit-like protein n=1 Tax=Bradyrhizobium sp. WD16 TaxID=1521768 RepID=UPI0020A41C8C|nr:terminase small subunit protein [Bradyrhizobium sp. WD16]